MTEIVVEKYRSTSKNDWNTFVKQAKNATFLFDRDFMDYHQDSFQDFSLMIYEGEKLLALLPANKVENKLYSHQGLTYGGLILSKKIKFEKVLLVFQSILQFLKENDIETLQLKLIPQIYVTYPADEITYLLFLLKAERVRCDISSAIQLKNPQKIQSNRLEGVKKAKKNGLIIKKESQFSNFWNEILTPNLEQTHNAKPVHSEEEIKLLAEKFPKDIHQFNVYLNEKIVGGATIFETENVAHVQYISANHQKQELGTLDFLFQHLIEKEFKHKNYFDFGTSNEQQGLKLNKGLSYWKECFGARSVAHEFYELKTSNFERLQDIYL
ncbi:GNAT family N-acetyltransferase [Mesonia maritima]|uniref:GNAT family N-acetyltransferase n=1 Tax=Mesonia maritima TaxID=1793873 RepID=A0ABU1K7G5_9FLAO|nr:GNAT family N-acetyltransferase [Mesonia maritima]MDR6301210.1 hypothetical protein [Mesonia maritima]